MSGIVAQNLNRQSGLIKAPEGGGSWTFIKKLTASSDGSLSFVNGASDVVLDGTYAEYIFYFTNMHPSNDNVLFEVNLSIDTGSNYNVAKTTTAFKVRHDESGSSGEIAYFTNYDLAQGTGGQPIAREQGSDNDQSVSGSVHLFAPSSTTFVKHFIAKTSFCTTGDGAEGFYVAGYGNTTSAVDAVEFKFSAGNIDTGDIFLHGLTI